MIQFNGVSKQYGDVDALQEVSFALRSGEILGYIGPNGAGKTTTLRILTGLVSGYRGEVLVDSENVERRRHDLHRLIGYLPQGCGFQEWRTAAGMLTTFGRLSGIESTRLEGRVRAVVNLLGIAEYADRKISQLSGGTRQKLLFAQAILHDPQLLILDEPLTGLDPTSRHQMKQIVRAARDDGRTVLLSSHVLADVEDLADRIAIINRGSIVADGTPAELRERYGSDNVVEVSVSGGPGVVDSILQSLPPRTREDDIGPTTRHLRFADESDASRAMKMLLTELGASDHDVRSVRRIDPSLEEIYISLTEKRR